MSRSRETDQTFINTGAVLHPEWTRAEIIRRQGLTVLARITDANSPHQGELFRVGRGRVRRP